MDFKDHLGIKDKDWLGIGRHLGELVRVQLDTQGKTEADLAEHLRLPSEITENSIQPNVTYIKEYIETYSFGVFWPDVQKYLGIKPDMIFTEGLSKTDLQSAKGSLTQYLTTFNRDAFVPFLTVSPGEPLRKHIAKALQKALKKFREEMPKLYPGHKVDTDEDAAKYFEILPDKFKNMIYGGDVSQISEQHFNRFFNKLGCWRAYIEINDICPVREPTEAESYELYQKGRKELFVVCASVHGSELGGAAQDRIPTIKQRPIEKQTYDSTIMMIDLMLMNYLHELVK